MRGRVCIPLLLCLCLGGCGIVSIFSSDDIDLETVKIRTMSDANDNHATAIDLVLVAKNACKTYVSQLSAREWFAKHTQILRDYPGCLTIKSWELAPGQQIRADVDANAIAAYVFADYDLPGDHRIQVNADIDTIHIILKKNDVFIQEQESTP